MLQIHTLVSQAARAVGARAKPLARAWAIHWVLIMVFSSLGLRGQAQLSPYISLKKIEELKNTLPKQDLSTFSSGEQCEYEILMAVEELKVSNPKYHWIGMPSSFEAQAYFIKMMQYRFEVTVVDDGCLSDGSMECHNLVIEAAIKLRFGESVLKELEEECEEIAASEEIKMEEHKRRFDIRADQVIIPIDTLK